MNKKAIRRKHVGHSPHRRRHNPLERAFAEAWEEHNTDEPDWFSWVLNPKGRPFTKHVSNDARMMTNSVIQWLGSPIGQGFLVRVLSGSDAAIWRQMFELECKDTTLHQWWTVLEDRQ